MQCNELVVIEQCRNKWVLFNICQCNRGVFKIKQKIKHLQYTCNIKYFVYLNYTVTLSFSSVTCKTQKEQKLFPSFTLKNKFCSGKSLFVRSSH